MNKPRSGAGLAVFNDDYIFAFGGRDKYNPTLSRIEAYDIAQDSWRLIIYAGNMWPGAYLCQAHQINRDEFLIFGSSLAQSEGASMSYRFTPDTGEFSESEPLAEPSGFANPGIQFRNHFYIIGSKGKIHFFQTGKKEIKWDVLNRTSI